MPITNILQGKSDNEILNDIKHLSDHKKARLAINNNSLKEFIFKNELIGPIGYSKLLVHFVKEDSFSDVAFILIHKLNKSDFEDAIILANKGEKNTLELLEFDKRYDPSLRNNYLIKWHSRNGNAYKVKELLKDERVDPSDGKNKAIEGAYVYEHKEIIKLLLMDKRVKDTLTPNEKKKYVVENIGNILRPKDQEEVFKSALEIKDPDKLLRIAIEQIKSNELVKIAIERGANVNDVNVEHVKSAETLGIILQNINKEIPPNKIIYKALKLGLEKEIIDLINNELLSPIKLKLKLVTWSIGFARNKVLDVILKNKEVKSHFKMERESLAEALAIAIARENMETVNKILDTKIDPGAYNNMPIKIAASYGILPAVERLLPDDRVDASDKDLSTGSDNYAIKEVFNKLKDPEDDTNKENLKTILNLLLKDKNVRNKLSKEEIKIYQEHGI